MAKCNADGCSTEQKYLRKGYCNLHYSRIWRHGDLELRRRQGGICIEQSCTEKTYARDWCKSHYHSNYVYPEYTKKNNLYIKRMYGIDQQTYQGMLDGGCMVCGSKDKLCIDHDHSCCSGRKTCGKCIRGVLCSACNAAEGYLRSDISRVLALAEYLKQNEKR